MCEVGKRALRQVFHSTHAELCIETWRSMSPVMAARSYNRKIIRIDQAQKTDGTIGPPKVLPETK